MSGEEPFRLQVELTRESTKQALAEAILLVSAAYGGAETYFSMGSELATKALADLDLAAVSNDDLQVLANRIAHIGVGLAIVAVQALHRALDVTDEDLQDVLGAIEDHHDEAWS